jgi:hypothetical protein
MTALTRAQIKNSSLFKRINSKSGKSRSIKEVKNIIDVVITIEAKGINAKSIDVSNETAGLSSFIASQVGIKD